MSLSNPGATERALTFATNNGDLSREMTDVLNTAALADSSNSFSGNQTIDGRVIETLTTADVDAQDHTLTAAQIFGGVVVHTSETGGGTVTTDTAVAIVAAGLAANGEAIKCYYINDGDQTLTFAGGTDVTVSDTGQTIAANESAVLLFVRTSATEVTLHLIGG